MNTATHHFINENISLFKQTLETMFETQQAFSTGLAVSRWLRRDCRGVSRGVRAGDARNQPPRTARTPTHKHTHIHTCIHHAGICKFQRHRHGGGGRGRCYCSFGNYCCQIFSLGSGCFITPPRTIARVTDINDKCLLHF